MCAGYLLVFDNPNRLLECQSIAAIQLGIEKVVGRFISTRFEPLVISS
jgi:hypothetical protein